MAQQAKQRPVEGFFFMLGLPVNRTLPKALTSNQDFLSPTDGCPRVKKVGSFLPLPRLLQ
jgi:hypothetical protein